MGRQRIFFLFRPYPSTTAATNRLLATAPNFYQQHFTNNTVIPDVLIIRRIQNSHPLIIGPSTGLEAPYPLQMKGKVISGFGRGSRELGIPTANLPVDDMDRRYQVRGVLWLGVPTPTAVTSEPTNDIIKHHHDNHGPGGALRVQPISHGDVDRVQRVLQEHGAVG